MCSCFNPSYNLSKSKSLLDAEIKIMKLQEEIDKLKEKHFLEAEELKTKIEQQKAEKTAIQRELGKIREPKTNLNVSNK